MSLYKRGGVWWFHFVWRGKHIQRSTKLTNKNAARDVESTYRTALAKGELGLVERKPAPVLSDFCKRVETYAKAQYERTTPKTWKWYEFGLKTIKASELSQRKMDEVTAEHIAGFVASLQSKEWEISSINSALRAVRRVFRLAKKWGVIQGMPEVSLLRGENHREHVVTAKEEAKYLAACVEPLASIATVLIDTGLRPDECFRLRWEHVNLNGERFGALRVTEGKTKAARRVIPLTQRVHAVLKMRWDNAKEPAEGWVFPAPTKQEHVWHDSIRVQHKNAVKTSEVRPFVIYALRHTFLTRLGESGCDVWTLARIAGHSSIKMSERYVHPGGDAVLAAMSRMTLPIS